MNEEGERVRGSEGKTKSENIIERRNEKKNDRRSEK